MRSFQELTFRFRQEAANAFLYFSSPNLRLQATAPLDVLPSPNAVGEALRNTEYARHLTQPGRRNHARVAFHCSTAWSITDSTVAWRRDPQRGIETPQTYFRRIPYLDLAAAGDHKLIWEINRHQHLVLLAQALRPYWAG